MVTGILRQFHPEGFRLRAVPSVDVKRPVRFITCSFGGWSSAEDAASTTGTLHLQRKTLPEPTLKTEPSLLEKSGWAKAENNSLTVS